MTTQRDLFDLPGAREGVGERQTDLEQIIEEKAPVMTVFEAFHHHDDGSTWLRITDQRSGDQWDEPIAGWTLHHVLMAKTQAGLSGSYYQHRDGRIAKAT